MATATRVRVRRAIQRAALLPFEPYEAVEAEYQEKSWFRVHFQAGEGDEPYVDSHVVRASNPTEARCAVERYEREIARALGPHSVCSPDSIHAVSVDILPDHSYGAVDG